MLNRFNGEELRQVMLYFKLGVIAFSKKKKGRTVDDVGRDVMGSMTDEEIGTLSLFVFLGVIAYYLPENERLLRLRASGIDLIEEVKKELEHA